MVRNQPDPAFRAQRRVWLQQQQAQRRARQAQHQARRQPGANAGAGQDAAARQRAANLQNVRFRALYHELRADIDVLMGAVERILPMIVNRGAGGRGQRQQQRDRRQQRPGQRRGPGVRGAGGPGGRGNHAAGAPRQGRQNAMPGGAQHFGQNLFGQGPMLEINSKAGPDGTKFTQAKLVF